MNSVGDGNNNINININVSNSNNTNTNNNANRNTNSTTTTSSIASRITEIISNLNSETPFNGNRNNNTASNRTNINRNTRVNVARNTNNENLLTTIANIILKPFSLRLNTNGIVSTVSNIIESSSSHSPQYDQYDDQFNDFDIFVTPGQEPIYDLNEQMTTLSKKSTRNHRTRYEREFESLLHYELRLIRRVEKANLDLFTTAHKEINKKKNRYEKVLPNEDTRVRLLDPTEKTEGDQGKEYDWDYFNANYIDRSQDDKILSKDVDYIAAQAPIVGDGTYGSGTVGDFLRMISVHDDVKTIVLLTKVNESDKEKVKEVKETIEHIDKSKDTLPHKADRYWPKKGEKSKENFYFSKDKYETYEVETLDEVTNGDITEYKIKVTRDGKSKEYQLIHYTGWDDDLPPTDTKGVLALSDKISQCKGRIVVQCPGGINRTGSFITIDTFIRRMKNHMATNPIKFFDFNIYNVVKELKTRRMGMVMDYKFYQFCHEVILAAANNLKIPQPSTIQINDIISSELLTNQDSK